MLATPQLEHAAIAPVRVAHTVRSVPSIQRSHWALAHMYHDDCVAMLFIAAATAAMAEVDRRSTDRQSPERDRVPGGQPNAPGACTRTNPRPAVPHADTPNIRWPFARISTNKYIADCENILFTATTDILGHV